MPRLPLLALALPLLAAALQPTRTAAQEGADAKPKPIKALLVIGGCCHDYKNQGRILTEGISARANVEWTIAYDPDKGTQHLNPVYENPDWAKGFDVVVHDECSADVRDLQVIERILKPHRDGLPAVMLHCAMHSYRSEGYPGQDTPWFQFTGVPSTAHGKQEPITLEHTDADHPITRGLQGWTTGKEELYNNVRSPLPSVHPLVTGKQEGQKDAVVAWTNAYGDKKAKVFGTTLGHNNETVADARYLDLITRGLLWSVGKLDDHHFKPVRAEGRKTLDATKLASAGAKEEECCEEETTTTANANANAK
jgi:type 1 glutamine amidotransferase